jgi:ABC-type nitrate/sulfonate/bicarbonate transport system substrate-binding protein
LSAVRFLPIIVGVILAGAMVYTAMAMVPATTAGVTNIPLRVGYPDSLDESDVTDMYAYSQILAPEGIHVTPTFYDAPPLSYKGLISGQQDIAFDTSAQTIALGPGGNPPQQTTCVTSYALAGVFLSIAGQGITSPQQMIGKASDDFGPGSSTRSLNLYWYSQAHVPVSQDAPNSSAVELRNIGGNIARVADLQSKKAGAIVVDDFILADFTGSQNTTANGGPFHVLFYAPNNFYDNCFAVEDSWLQGSTNGVPNTQTIVKFIQAIIQAQRYFISNPAALVTFASGQLPLTNVSEIQFTSTFYPAHYTYWPYGAYNLKGSAALSAVFAQTNTYFQAVGILASPVSNSSVQPYGVINAYFEQQALVNLGKYTYPASSSWMTPEFQNYVSSVVPTQYGSVG